MTRQLSAADQERVNQYKQQYDTAKANNDPQGMAAAHASAEAIRSNYGYSGGVDGSQYIALQSGPSLKLDGDGAGNAAASNEDGLSKMVEDARIQTDMMQSTGRSNDIDPATQAQIDRLKTQVEQERLATQNANKELYRQYRIEQEKLDDQLVGMGLGTTGIGGKMQAQLAADWISGANANQIKGQSAEDDLEYQMQIAELQARQQAEERRLAEAQQKAATLAQYGDFSGYYSLGYTADQVAQMERAYAEANAPAAPSAEPYQGLSDYAMTLLNLYQANPAYNIQGGLQDALDAGLITQLDFIAALQTAAGMAV